MVQWSTEAAGGLAGDMHVSEVYLQYLRSCDEDPVSRDRFVADLDYLGIVSDDDSDLAFS